MKFVILKNKLIEALNIVSKAASTKNPRPLLTGIKFELNSHGLFLTGYDGQIAIVTKVPTVDKDGMNIITIFENGICLVSSRVINEVVKGMEEDRITIETVEENVIKITDSTSDFSLNCMDWEEYPQIELNAPGSTFKLETAVLSNIISETAFAASDKDGRVILTGVNLKANEGTLKCVATDSYRIARKVVKLDSEATFNVTIPARTLVEIGKIGEAEKVATVTVSERKVIFKFENTLIVTQVLTGAYPDTDRLLQQTHTNILTVNAQSFISSVERVSKLATDRNNIVRLVMNQQQCTVSTRSQESGAGKINVSFLDFQGPALDISFTSRYVVEGIKATNSDVVEIRFDGDIKPFVVAKKDEQSSIQLILPVRTF